MGPVWNMDSILRGFFRFGVFVAVCLFEEKDINMVGRTIRVCGASSWPYTWTRN